MSLEEALKGKGRFIVIHYKENYQFFKNIGLGDGKYTAFLASFDRQPNPLIKMSSGETPEEAYQTLVEQIGFLDGIA